MISKKFKLIAILIIVISLSFTGCINLEAKEKKYYSIPENTILIYEHVTEAWINYNYWNSANGATYTYLWLDIRNVGRNDVYDLRLRFEDFPANDWGIAQIYNKNKMSGVEFDPTTQTVKCLKAQHNLDDDTWAPEHECTILLRIKISCGQKGGYDTDLDGVPNHYNPNIEGEAVGTFPGDYYVNFHIDHPEIKETTISLMVHVENLPVDDMKEPNPDYPYYPI